MANHLESNLVAFNASLLLKQLGEGPFLKEIAKSYQLDLQCTLNLESLLSQENLQSEGQQEGSGLQDKIRVVIKELVTVKNHYFHILIQALSLLQKQQQRISAKSVFLQLHNVINSHKDSQISTLKSIIKSLGLDPDSRTLPSKTDIQGLQERVNGSNREDIVSKIKQSNSINLDRSNSQNHGNPTQKPNSSRSRPTSTHKRNPSFAKDTMSGSYTAQTLSSKNLNNNALQKRYSDCKKETHLSQELLNIAQRYKGAAETRRPMTEKKSGVRDVVTSVFNQDVKQVPTTRKTQKSPIRSAGNSAPSTQKNQKRQTKGDLFENLIDALRIESVELPKGVRLFTEKNHTQSQLNTQRSAEVLNTEYLCQEKLLSAHGSTILSRSPDSTPNITPSGSRIYTTEDMSMLNRKDSIDINALQKGLKKSCRKLMKRRASLESLRDRGVKETLNDEAGQRKVQRTRRSKSIGETPTYFYGPDESATFDVPVGKTNNKQASGKSSPVSEVKVGNFLQSQVVSDARNYNSQSSIAGSLLHDINSISCCNHVDVVIVNKDQENQGREELSAQNVKNKMQIYGLRDVSRVFEGRGNLSARNSVGYVGDVKQIYTERGCRPQEGNDPQMQRRKSLGRRDEPVKLEVMYGTKTMKKVKNWAPVLPKKVINTD